MNYIKGIRDLVSTRKKTLVKNLQSLRAISTVMTENLQTMPTSSKMEDKRDLINDDSK